MIESDEGYYPRGLCWFLGRCNWWNPPDNLLFSGIDFCIRCWKWQQEETKK